MKYSYHNTTNEDIQTLMEFEVKAEVEDEEVYQMFLNGPWGGMTADDVYYRILMRDIDRLNGASLIKACDYARNLDKKVRRSITNLVRKHKKLKKTERKKMGSLGRMNTVYQLVRNREYEIAE